VRRRYPAQRFVLAAGAAGLLLLGLVARMFWLQVVTTEQWQREVVRQSSQQVQTPARRGSIYDRNGTPLALTEERVKVGVTDPSHWRKPAHRGRLAQALDLDPSHLDGKLKGRSGHVVVHGSAVLAPEVLATLGREPTVTLHRYYRRTYPMGALATRLLGRVGSSGQGDAGVELYLDDRLAGSPGLELVVRDGLRRETLRRVSLVPPAPGADVRLTLDARMQAILEDELLAALEASGAEEGQAILMDPRTGEVLALAEAPLLGDRDRRAYPVDQWRTRAATDLFEPGSTFKLFTFASLLSHAVVDTAETFDGEKVPGKERTSADLGPVVLNDDHAVGVVSLRHAFAVSSNIVTGKVVSYLRREEFHADLRRFGLGTRTGSGWPAETVGILHDPAEWEPRSKPTVAIGQEIGVSLLQLVSGYSALVGDGTLRSPRFLLDWSDSRGRRQQPASNVIRRRVVSPSVIEMLRELCRNVVEQPYGTGTKAAVVGLDVAGKTGTGQIPTKGGYRRDAFTASFVGFAPSEDPRLVGAVVLHGARGAGRWGGQSAAPAFSNVLRRILISTHWLDAAAAAEATVAPEPDAEVPDLRGLGASEVSALADAEAWIPEPPAPAAHARVVSQMPRPGTPLRAGTRVRLAWASGESE